MRLGVIHGNGCTCSICKKILQPKEAVKIYAKKLHEDSKLAATGHYQTLGKMDLCDSCYKKLIKPNIEKSRRKVNYIPT